MSKPTSPGGTIGIGVFFLVFGLIMLIPTLANPAATTQLGFPLPLIVAVLVITGIGFVIWGAVWVRRGKQHK